MKKFLIFGLGIVVAIAGTYFISNYKASLAPDNNQNITIKPSGPSDVGGADYVNNTKQTGHYVTPTNNWRLPASTSFIGKLSTLTSAGFSGGSSGGIDSISNVITMSPIWNNDWGDGFVSESLVYSTNAKIDNDTERTVTYTDTNTFAETFELGETKYWVNGQETTYANLSNFTNKGYYLTGSHAVINYEEKTVDINHYAILLECGTYSNANSSVVLVINDFGTSSSFTLEDGTVITFDWANFEGYRGDGNLAFTFGYQPATGDYQTVELSVIDYDKLSYNGVILTLDKTVA